MKKVYTGAYLLYNKDNITQFGLVDGTANMESKTEVVRISFNKQVIEKIQLDENCYTINLTLEECAKLADVLKNVEHSLELLKTLSKRDKLKDDAYLTELDPNNSIT